MANLFRRYQVRIDHLYSAPGWLQDGADIIEEDIVRSNNDAWPLSLRQLRRAAGQHGLAIDLLAETPLMGTVAANMIAVRDTGEPLTTWPRIIHEIAEKIARTSAHPLFNTPGDARIYDQVARVVEARYALYLAGMLHVNDHVAQIKWQARAARRSTDVELTYAPDEAETHR